MTATLSRTPRSRPAPPSRRRWPAALTLLLVLGVLATAGIVVFFTPVLGLKSVAVEGATGAVATQVVQAVGVPDGTPLIRVDLAAVTGRLEAVPAVSSASVDRAWPNGLIVHVKVRVPVARTSANGATWLMDSSGLLYARTGPGVEVPAGLAVLELATPGPGDPATTAALTVAAALTPALRAQVRTPPRPVRLRGDAAAHRRASGDLGRNGQECPEGGRTSRPAHPPRHHLRHLRPRPGGRPLSGRCCESAERTVLRVR